jgi:hypothetical protein
MADLVITLCRAFRRGMLQPVECGLACKHRTT